MRAITYSRSKHRTTRTATDTRTIAGTARLEAHQRRTAKIAAMIGVAMNATKRKGASGNVRRSDREAVKLDGP